MMRGLLGWWLLAAPLSAQVIPDTAYTALWQHAHALMDEAVAAQDTVPRNVRYGLYTHAERYARRAIAANPAGANGHFVLAAILGRRGQGAGARARARDAADIRREAEAALAIDSTHSGAWNVLGQWHAEIRRLSAIERFAARNFLGGAMDGASWDAAEHALRQAVRYQPWRMYHHLVLAGILVDRKKWDEARQVLALIDTLPVREPMDQRYQEDARRLATRLPVSERR